MPVVESVIAVPVDAATAFAVSQTTGRARLRWDPFIRRQWFTDGADAPGKDVRTTTLHRTGIRMVSTYVSYQPPTNVGITMTSGPWFLASFSGGWQFRALAEADDGTPRTRVTWRYNFRCRPKWLAPLLEAIGTRVLQRDIDRRVVGFAAGCLDPEVLAAARAIRG